MARLQRDNPPTLAPRAEVRPRSPSEALEPGRAPPRPRGVKVRRESRAVSRLVRVVSSALTLALVLMIAGSGALALLYNAYERPGPLAETKTVVIAEGEGRNQIAEHLEMEGVISSQWGFMANYVLQNFTGDRKMLSLKHGEYEFKPGVSMREVMEILGRGKSVGYGLTVREGLTSKSIIDLLAAEQGLEGDAPGVPPEGAIAPDTYQFSRGMERSELLARMQEAQTEILNAAWEKRQPDLPFETKEQALVLASIVEKETGQSDERAKVAAVFINRLRKSMPLQSDPTILYGLYGGSVQWGKPIMQSEKEAKNAHNTYQIKGLPPTPICNPGKAAIEATLNPEKTKDLYFVANGSGGHIFSATLEEHNQAVANWRKIEKEMRARQEAQAKAAAEAPGNTEAAALPTVQPAGATRAVIRTVPEQAKGGADVPNPPAEAAGSATPPPASAQAPVAAPVEPIAAQGALQASTIPLPVRKPKR